MIDVVLGVWANDVSLSGAGPGWRFMVGGLKFHDWGLAVRGPGFTFHGQGFEFHCHGLVFHCVGSHVMVKGLCFIAEIWCHMFWG